MRASLHFALSLVLLSCFVQAPFAHVHDDDPGHEHAHGLGHAHFGEHETDGPEIEAEEHADGDARLLNWVAGDGTTVAKQTLALPVELIATSAEVRGVQVPEPATRSHDPPGLERLPGRSPPQ